MNDKCPKCGEPFIPGGKWDGVCIDCWSGYDMCKACGDYRCEHFEPTIDDLIDPSYTSCACGSMECRTGFIDGSERKVVTRKEFTAIKQSWGFK